MRATGQAWASDRWDTPHEGGHSGGNLGSSPICGGHGAVSFQRVAVDPRERPPAQPCEHHPARGPAAAQTERMVIPMTYKQQINAAGDAAKRCVEAMTVCDDVVVSGWKIYLWACGGGTLQRGPVQKKRIIRRYFRNVGGDPAHWRDGAVGLGWRDGNPAARDPLMERHLNAVLSAHECLRTACEQLRRSLTPDVQEALAVGRVSKGYSGRLTWHDPVNPLATVETCEHDLVLHVGDALNRTLFSGDVHPAAVREAYSRWFVGDLAGRVAEGVAAVGDYLGSLVGRTRALPLLSLMPGIQARIRIELVAAKAHLGAAGVATSVVAAGECGDRKRPRNRRGQPRKPTQNELEAVLIVGQCAGNIAEAARLLRKSYSTVREQYRAGLSKAGEAGPPKPRTQGLPLDRRDQVAVAVDRRRG